MVTWTRPNENVSQGAGAPAGHGHETIIQHSKYQYNVDILTFTTEEFIQNISTHSTIREALNH